MATGSGRVVGVLALIGCALVLAGCAGEPAPPSLSVVWADGEQSNYEVRTADTLAGTFAVSIERTAEGWSQRYESNRRGRVDKGEVRMDEKLRPLSSWREADEGRTQAEYDGSGRVTVRKPPPQGGDPVETTLQVSGVVMDNEASLMVQRGLAVPEGGETSYVNVVPRSATDLRVRVADDGVRTIDTPAGKIEARCLALRGSGPRQTACYATAAPHALVLYENPPAQVKFVLRSFRPGKDAAWHGDTSPVAVPTERVPIHVGKLVLALLAVVPFMLALPIFLGWYFRRRFGAPWRLWAFGAVTFVASQVVHLPLNWALGLLGKPRALGLLAPPLLAVVVGLSAGLCEELARYVAWRFALKKYSKTYHEALQFGAGHGGIEALIVGVIAVIQVGSMVVLSLVSPETLGIPPAHVGAVQSQVDTFWLTPWYLMPLGGIERLFAITFHILATVLVVRAVARRQPVWLLLAIALHTAGNAWAVWAGGKFGTVASQGGWYLFGIACLLALLALRPRGGTGAAPSDPAGEEGPPASPGAPASPDAPASSGAPGAV